MDGLQTFMASVSAYVDSKLGRGFSWLGSKVARRPKSVTGLSLGVAVLLSLGLVRLHVVSNDDELYVPKHSLSVKRGSWASGVYNVDVGTKSLSLYCVSATSSKNVLRDRQGLAALFDVSAKIEDALSHKWRKNNSLGEPMSTGPLGFWNRSQAAFQADEAWRATLFDAPLNPYGLTTMDDHGNVEPEPEDLDHIFGKFKSDDGEATSAEATQSKFWVVGDTPNKVLRRADKAVSRASPVNGELHCYLHSHTSYRDAVLGAITHDMILVAISVLVLFAFSTGCFASRACRGGWRLGPAAILSVLLALASAFGLWMVSGGYFHALMGAVLFMVLGLGVDDAFVIVDAVDLEFREARQDEEDADAVADILGKALEKAGASVLVTSATDAAAFGACAITSVIPALSSFCACAALAVALDFAFQVTFFVALVALESYARLENDRKERLDDIFSGRPRATKEKKLRVATKAATVILLPSCRVASLVVAVGLVAAGAYGASQLEVDFESKWLAPTGSMVRKASDVEDKYFVETNHWFVDVYTKADSPDLLNSIDDYRSAVSALRNLSWAISDKFWLTTFDAFVVNDTDAFVDIHDFDVQTSLYALEQRKYFDRLGFRPPEGGSCWAGSLPFDKFLRNDSVYEEILDEPYSICATKIELEWKKIEQKAKQIERLDTAQHRIDNHVDHLDMFVLRSPTLEALALTWIQTRQSVILVAVAVVVCCLFLLGRVWATALLFCVLAAIDVILLGSLWYIGETCNTVTTVILTLAIGLSVDFSAHLTHAFLHSPDGVGGALARMLPPISKGAASTLLAVLPMAASTSYVIRLFFKVCALIITVAYFFGAFVVPAVLHTFVAPCLDPRPPSPPQDGGSQRSWRRSGRVSSDAYYALANSFTDGADGFDAPLVADDAYAGMASSANSRLRVFELCRTDEA